MREMLIGEVREDEKGLKEREGFGSGVNYGDG